MSLVLQIQSLILRIGTEFKTVKGQVGSLGNLTTTEKTNLVGALNELKLAISGAAGINDAVTGTATTWSSNKISARIDAAVAALVNSAPGALDTLGELAAQLAADEGQITSLLNALGNRVRIDAPQALTAGQQAQAIANIGAISAADVGDVSSDFVASFNTALT